MTMWMDKIDDHIDYNSMGDYSNIGIYVWYLVLQVNCFIFQISRSCNVYYM